MGLGVGVELYRWNSISIYLGFGQRGIVEDILAGRKPGMEGSNNYLVNHMRQGLNIKKKDCKLLLKEPLYMRGKWGWWFNIF